jgi:hypothetical protein
VGARALLMGTLAKAAREDFRYWMTALPGRGSCGRDHTTELRYVRSLFSDHLNLQPIEAAMSNPDVSVTELIAMVSRDLLASRAARISRGDPAIFEVDELTLELAFVVTNSVGGGVAST